MWLSQLNEMSVGPLWVLRKLPAVAAPDTDADTDTDAGLCPVCAASWAVLDMPNAETLIVLPEPLTTKSQQTQQTLLANCLRAAGLVDNASCLTLHAGCAPDALAGIAALQRHLESHPVARVIVFGESAALSIDPAFRRGAIHAWQQTSLVVTHHPAQMLENGALKAQTWSDLCLALFDSATSS